MFLISIFIHLLHFLPGELAHHVALKSLKIMHFLGLTEVLLKTRNTQIESNDRDIRKLRSKVGIAAGLDKNGEYIDCLAALGVSFIEVGTVTPRPQRGNDKPRLFKNLKEKALLNRLGFNNKGVDNLVHNLKRRKTNIIVGSSIGKNFDTPNEDAYEDYVYCLDKVYRYSDYIAVNISSPNTQDLRSFHNQTKLDDLLKAINLEKKNLNTKIPIAVKISPDIQREEIDKISEVLLNNNIEAVIISNSSEMNRDYLQNIQKYQKGGLSGKPIEEKSTKLIHEFYKILKGKIKIIGVGGVDSGRTAYEKFLAGADYVQLYTGMVYRGPNIVNMIKKELKEILLKDGVKNFSEIVGKKTVS